AAGRPGALAEHIANADHQLAVGTAAIRGRIVFPVEVVLRSGNEILAQGDTQARARLEQDVTAAVKATIAVLEMEDLDRNARKMGQLVREVHVPAECAERFVRSLVAFN